MLLKTGDKGIQVTYLQYALLSCAAVPVGLTELLGQGPKRQ